jgi:hypothetical protein
VGDLMETAHLEYTSIDERIILKGIFKKWNERACTC